MAYAVSLFKRLVRYTVSMGNGYSADIKPVTRYSVSIDNETN